mmetsp:Transcript_62635/g.136949  ORF Transcript_62635/g.136949 Transcript_62635/m.136949 type:complete len:310 (+) Transcript_62635:960-1889(+)
MPAPVAQTILGADDAFDDDVLVPGAGLAHQHGQQTMSAAAIETPHSILALVHVDVQGLRLGQVQRSDPTSAQLLEEVEEVEEFALVLRRGAVLQETAVRSTAFAGSGSTTSGSMTPNTPQRPNGSVNLGALTTLGCQLWKSVQKGHHFACVRQKFTGPFEHFLLADPRLEPPDVLVALLGGPFELLLEVVVSSLEDGHLLLVLFSHLPDDGLQRVHLVSGVGLDFLDVNFLKLELLQRREGHATEGPGRSPPNGFRFIVQHGQKVGHHATVATNGHSTQALCCRPSHPRIVVCVVQLQETSHDLRIAII